MQAEQNKKANYSFCATVGFQFHRGGKKTCQETEVMSEPLSFSLESAFKDSYNKGTPF
jgi:hypothetical protein